MCVTVLIQTILELTVLVRFRTDGWMDGWRNGDGWRDGWMNGWTRQQIDKHGFSSVLYFN